MATTGQPGRQVDPGCHPGSGLDRALPHCTAHEVVHRAPHGGDLVVDARRAHAVRQQDDAEVERRVAPQRRARETRVAERARRDLGARPGAGLQQDGRVAYELKKQWKDGTTHVVLTPQVLLERLCALVPRPRGGTW
jgi:hypothetical protein